MNIRSIKFILVGTIAAFSLAGTSSAADPIVINAKKNLPTDYAGAEKIFQANDPAVVFKLTPLPQEALERAYRLPDTNRKAIGRTAVAPVEYHYTLDSASKQAEIEVKKALEDSLKGGMEKKEEKETSKIGECSFYVTASMKDGITIMFRNSTLHFGKYEVMIEPLEASINGTSGIHRWLDQTQWNSYMVTADQAIITRMNIPWSSLQVVGTNGGAAGSTNEALPLKAWGSLHGAMGEYPIKGGVPVQWKISVYRWSPGYASSLRGIPYENADTYLNTPSFLQKDELNAKSGMIHGSVTGFYSIDPKKGNAVENNLNYIINHRRNLIFYCERFGLKPKQVYPRTFSEYYLADKVRVQPKEFPGEPQKTLEANYRL